MCRYMNKRKRENRKSILAPYKFHNGIILIVYCFKIVMQI